MGLFSRGNAAEKKLKKITGGFILNQDYMNKLKENNLSIDDGFKIKNQVKDEIKEGKIDENDVKVRINQLIRQYSKSEVSSLDKTCPKCGEVQEFKNTFCINCGYNFADEQISCPFCNEKQDKSNKFCINCGKNINAPKYLKKCPLCLKIQDANNTECFNCKEDLTQVDYEHSSDLVFCPDCHRKIPKESIICPFCEFNISTGVSASKDVEISTDNDKEPNSQLLESAENTEDNFKQIEFMRKTQFLNNYDFNLKTCPECNTKFLKADPFCFNCGSSVLTQDTVKNDNLEVRDGKLVEKSSKEFNDELSSLEALYKQTVKSKYAPDFKIAYVLYLEHFRKNPSKKFSDKTAKNYETTVIKLEKQAVEDNFIEPASPLSAARDFKVSDLKEILKQYDLKVSGKKDELIKRLGENLSEQELKKHFKSKNYQISDDGLEFLANNNYILYVVSDKDISKVISPVDIAKIFEEKEYSDNEIYEKLLRYLKEMSDKKLTCDDWGEFRIYSNAIAQVLEDKGDLKEALNVRLKLFLFDLNNYSVVLHQAEPARTHLKQKDVTKLTRLLHKLTLPVDELKESFDTAYNETLFKTVISSQDSLIYLLKVFGGEDLNTISNEINEKYSNPY